MWWVHAPYVGSSGETQNCFTLDASLRGRVQRLAALLEEFGDADSGRKIRSAYAELSHVVHRIDHRLTARAKATSSALFQRILSAERLRAWKAFEEACDDADTLIESGAFARARSLVLEPTTLSTMGLAALTLARRRRATQH